MLRLGSFDLAFDAKPLVPFLRGSEGWSLRDFAFSTVGKSKAFERDVAKYVNTNSSLRKIVFIESFLLDESIMDLGPLVDAADSGARSLEGVEIDGHSFNKYD